MNIGKRKQLRILLVSISLVSLITCFSIMYFNKSKEQVLTLNQYQEKTKELITKVQDVQTRWNNILKYGDEFANDNGKEVTAETNQTVNNETNQTINNEGKEDGYSTAETSNNVAFEDEYITVDTPGWIVDNPTFHDLCNPYYASKIKGLAHEFLELAETFRYLKVENGYPLESIQDYEMYVLYFDTYQKIGEQMVWLANDMDQGEYQKAIITLDEIIRSYEKLPALH